MVAAPLQNVEIENGRFVERCSTIALTVLPGSESKRTEE